ncbi:alpha/beta-hydrolase [Salix suchowensis]|nr:alpha/beta-hydrolase [Salix suchowensis]
MRQKSLRLWSTGILGGTVTPQALALSRIMVDYWVSFATSLDPNDGKGLPRSTTQVSTSSESSLTQGRRALWTQYTPAIRQQQDVQLRFIKDSGVCETTPGVGQMSGYIDVGKNMSMRTDHAMSTQIGQLQPSTLSGMSRHRYRFAQSHLRICPSAGITSVTVSIRTPIVAAFLSNFRFIVIYIDQPIGTGFSHGVDTVNSTLSAAPPVWTAFQILFESGEFSKFKKRDGWYDPLIQNQAYVDFATNAPGYGQLQSDRVIARLNDAFFRPGGCKDQEEACFAAGDGPTSDRICRTADAFCVNAGFIVVAQFRVLNQDLSRSIMSLSQQWATGILTTYDRQPLLPSPKFLCQLPQDARTLLPQLAALADSGLKILIWVRTFSIEELVSYRTRLEMQTSSKRHFFSAGKWLIACSCNWLGGHASVLAMDWFGKERLNNTPFTNMTIDGEAVAAIQNVDNFSFA